MKVICINDCNGKFSKDGVIEGKEYEGSFGPIQEGRPGVWTIEGIDGIVYPGYMFEDADRVFTFEQMMDEIEDGFVFLNTKTNRKIKHYLGSMYSLDINRPDWYETNCLCPIELDSLWIKVVNNN